MELAAKILHVMMAPDDGAMRRRVVMSGGDGSRSMDWMLR